MNMLCLDCSNYTVEFTPELLQSWKARGVGLLILQAFPSWYVQYEEQQRQMRMCRQESMPFDAYIYDYLGIPDWLDHGLEGLTQLHEQEGLLPRMLWLDEEDVESAESATQQQRVVDINWSLIRADKWSADHGLQRAGIYTAAWWWVPKTGNSTQFSDRKLWFAQYDGLPDASVFTPFGGWGTGMARVKQYAGSQPDGTDLNVLSVDEEAELGVPVPEPEPVPGDCAVYRSAIERAVNRLQIEDERKTAAGPLAALRRKQHREIRAELFKVLTG